MTFLTWVSLGIGVSAFVLAGAFANRHELPATLACVLLGACHLYYVYGTTRGRS